MLLVWYFDFISPYSYLQFEAYPDMLFDYLEHPSVFDEPEMQRIANLPVGAARKP